MPKRAEDLFLGIFIFFGILFLVSFLPSGFFFQGTQWNNRLTVRGSNNVHIVFDGNASSCSDLIVSTGSTVIDHRVYNERYVNGKCVEADVAFDFERKKAFETVLLIPTGDFLSEMLSVFEPVYYVYYNRLTPTTTTTMIPESEKP